VDFRWAGDANIFLAIELAAGGAATRMVPKVGGAPPPGEAMQGHRARAFLCLHVSWGAHGAAGGCRRKPRGQAHTLQPQNPAPASPRAPRSPRRSRTWRCRAPCASPWRPFCPRSPALAPPPCP
jgi:hypothetical protein